MKEEIITTARRQLAEGGYSALSFAELANTHETTRANLHHHFGNKHGLAESALASYVEEALRGVRALVDQHEDDFPAFLAQVEKGMLASAMRGRADEACVCTQLLFDERAPADLKAQAKAFFAAKRSLMERSIRASQASGTLTTELKATVLAQRVAALLMGMSTALRVSDKPKATAMALKGALSAMVEP